MQVWQALGCLREHLPVISVAGRAQYRASRETGIGHL